MHLEVSEGHRTYYHYHVRYSLLRCNSNFVFKMRRFYDIRLQKYVVTLKSGQRSLKVIESGTIQ